MRRKAKELQQARRDAERQGKKAPGFGGFGSSAVSGGTTAAMITETIIETEKPKVAPAPSRWVCSGQQMFLGIGTENHTPKKRVSVAFLLSLHAEIAGRHG